MVNEYVPFRRDKCQDVNSIYLQGYSIISSAINDVTYFVINDDIKSMMINYLKILDNLVPIHT